MFYSHEILTSRQYGVATIWLVATIGAKATTRKINRKTILEVDVPKACETIVQPPGAPIALRLQGNLLYGVSQVYDQQCKYVLTDAEKVQTHMRNFLRMLSGGQNAIDPNAGKARRDQLMLADDPEFDLDMILHAPYIGQGGLLMTPPQTQRTSKTSSQMSPVNSGDSASGQASFIAGFDLPEFSIGGSVHLPSPFGQGSMSLPKPQSELPFFEEDELSMPMVDLGLEIDADGNISALQEPTLPPLPPLPGSGDQAVAFHDFGRPRDSGPARLQVDGQGDIIMNLDEEALPAAAAMAPSHRPEEVPQEQVAAVMAPERRRRPQKLIAADGVTRVGRDEFQSWNSKYLENMAKAAKPIHTTSSVVAKQNAQNLLFNLGIANIGMPTGIPGVAHPLSQDFAGRALKIQLLGLEAVEKEDGMVRGRRRSASEAFGSSDEEERRVRPRREVNEQQPGRMHDEEMLPVFGDEVEVGREQGSNLSELHSSVPWNRPPSVAPGSSVHSKTGGQAGSLIGRQVSSPLVGRGSALPDIERFSDNAPVFGSDVFQPILSRHSTLSDHRPFNDISGIEASQAIRDALDSEGRNFLAYAIRVAAEKGEIQEDDDGGAEYRWVDFSNLLEPTDCTKPVAAQAFFHVLSLVTKGAMTVMQDGAGITPFGTIRLGLPVEESLHDEDASGHGRDEDIAMAEDEEASEEETDSDHSSDVYEL